VLELIEAAGPRAERARAQVERILGPARAEGRPEAREKALRMAVLAAFPDRVARRRAPGSDEVLLAGGGSATLARESAVRESPLLVAVDAEERRSGSRAGVLVRTASAIDPEWLLELFPGELRDSTTVVWDDARQRAEVVARLSYGAIALEESRRAPGALEADEAARILSEHVRLEDVLDPEELAGLRGRADLIARACPEAGVRPISDSDVADALRRASAGKSSLDEVRAADVRAALLDPASAAALDRLAPEWAQLPHGRRLRIEYAPGQLPAARSRLQDFFGLSRGPSVAAGRVPVVLHLLAPNGRAQQVTQDLSGFWERHYPAVRRELMRRYPRHAWPENGATAVPPAPRKR
jgi:ATP-dependent helicase HrpB